MPTKKNHGRDNDDKKKSTSREGQKSESGSR